MEKDINIDEKTLQQIEYRIIKLERDNARVNKFDDKKMLEKIRVIIEEEISCL